MNLAAPRRTIEPEHGPHCREGTMYWLGKWQHAGMGPPRYSLRILTAILLFAGTAAAQDPGQRPAIEAQPTPGRTILSIDGRVVRGGDGSNVAGARVMLTDNRGGIRGIIYTRDGGSFQFPRILPGRYTLTISHQEYGEHTQTIDLILGPATGLVVRLSKAPPSPESLQTQVPVWALKVPDKAQEEYKKGVEALENGDAKLTVRHMRKAVELYPQFAAAHSALGNAHHKLGETGAATQAYKKALKIDEALYSAWLGLGTLYANARAHEEAERHLLRAQSLRPDDWQAWYQLGELYWEMKEPARTEEHIRRARELHHAIPRIHILLINALVVQEKYAESLVLMDEFVAQFPKSSLAAEVARKRDLLRAELSRATP
ncbi:MAG: carboxypeptidase regulatory-like domain-containing protein [Candidatus Acidiferrales bacterium]